MACSDELVSNSPFTFDCRLRLFTNRYRVLLKVAPMTDSAGDTATFLNPKAAKPCIMFTVF
jgi:hypothetical protein